MKLKWLHKECTSQSGQSLIETALVVPLLLVLVLNTINFAYYFMVCIHLASAPREGVQYSIQGFNTPSLGPLPIAGPVTNNTSVSYLTHQDMATLVNSSTAVVRVCTSQLGLSNVGLATQKANCQTYPGTASPGFSAVAADPEAPNFVLHRVDVQYTVTPLIGAGGFGLIVPNLTFHRQVSMRAM